MFFSPLKFDSFFRGLKDMEQDISSIEKRFAYGFLQKLLKWMDIAQEFIAHLGTIFLETKVSHGYIVISSYQCTCSR